MEFTKINEFLALDRKEIKNRYGFTLDRRVWFLLKNTSQRSGAFWPLGGFKSLGESVSDTRFISPGKKEFNKKPFDEEKNFRLSQVGEICSKPRCPSNGKGVLYWAYGYDKYIPILKPCTWCLKKNAKTCHCDTLMVALIDHFFNTVRSRGEDFYKPFKYDLSRSFNLLVCDRYSEKASLGPDRFTEFQIEGPLILSENIKIKDGKPIPSEPQKKGVLQSQQLLLILKVFSVLNLH